MFKVECLGCQAPYQVDERRVPEKGLKMRCPKCGTTFKVEPPTQSTTPSQAPAPAPEAPFASAPPPHPFTSGGVEPGRKLAKPPGGRDSLSRTMIGVSSADMEMIKDAQAAGKAKAFRIPRPNQPAPEREAPAAPAPKSPTAAVELDLPANPLRPLSFGPSARATREDAALPELVKEPRRGLAGAGAEVQRVMPSVAPVSESAWLGSDEVSDANAHAPPDRGPALSLSDLPQPLVASARKEAAKARAVDKPGPLELDFEEDLPVVATPQKRPPPRRARPAQADAGGNDDGADLPARPEDLELDLPAVAAPPGRPLDRAPRPPPRQKSSNVDELDLLPAVASRDEAGFAVPVTRPAAPHPLPPQAKPTLVDLPSARGRSARELSDDDLPAVGRGLPISGMAQGAYTTSDLPGVFGGGAQVAAPEPPVEVIGLPELLPSELPAVAATGLPEVVSRGQPRAGRVDSDLPNVFGGSYEAPPVGLPEVRGAGVARISDSGLPDVLGSGLPDVLGSGLPDVLGSGLPDVLGSGLPDVLGSGLPDVRGTDLPDVFGVGLPLVSDTGLPDVLASGLPEVSAAGLPDVLASGLPIVSAAGLPEVFGPGVAGFGRVDLPVPRPAELPEVRGHIGFDEVDLPGVGESLPSVAESWGNLPTMGESLPTAKGQGAAGSFDESTTPFGDFGEVDGDPFAGSEADFGAPEGDDPFAAPGAAEDEDEFAPAQGDDGREGGLRARPAGGGGYGEVSIDGAESDDSALETADDMEFQAIPQRGSASPGRAAASASVHADGLDNEATGSTLELGPERKTSKARTRRVAAALAICFGAIAGGALALKPAIGPFGIHFVMDQLKRGERERLLTQLAAEAQEAGQRDTLAAVQASLRAVEQAREGAPRFEPLSARSALDHYKAALRYGPLPNMEATARVALDQLEPDSEEALDRLARAAQAAVARDSEAKARLEALGNDPDARELLGELSLRNKDWVEASKIWAELRQSEPTSARAAFGLARAQLGLGKANEALSEARQVLALTPEHVGAPILMLEAQRALQNGVDAKAGQRAETPDLVASVMRVLPEASPGEAALAHCVLGELHSSQGRTGPAQQEFESALGIDRSLPRALIGLGEVLHGVGRDGEALARFDAAAKAEPASLAAALGIAKSQIRLGQLNEGKASLARLAQTHPGDPDVTFWAGKTEQAMGNNDAALAAYRAAIVAGKGRADSVDAYLALAKLQADLGQLSLAQETLSEARGKLPPNGPLQKALGEIALSRADAVSAYEHFQKALELDPGDTRARFLGAVALTRLGRFDEALAAFQNVGQTDKDFPGLAVERGRLFEESGRNLEALAEYEAALKKTPEDPEVMTRVGCARMIAAQTAPARELLEKATKIRPRSAEANYCLGRALFDEERYIDGMVRLERAANIDPTRAIYQLYVGWVASELGRQSDAQKSFDKAIELDRGLADAYWQRGRLRLKQGAAKDAIVDLERARQLKPTRYEAMADLAVAYSDIGRMPKALELWEEAIAKDADNPTWHFRYGKLLSTSGNGAMAAAHVKRAIELVAESQAAAPSGDKPKAPLWLWQAHYLLARELGNVPASVPQWQAYLRLSPHDDPYRPEAERALRELGHPWQQR
jgi:predicted Zn finger-like uncharacterized protein